MTGTPVKPVSQGKEWRAPAGTTLRENIIKWAEETKCESMASTHWMVIWPLSVTDYRLDAPLMFRDHLNQPWSRYLSYIGLRKNLYTHRLLACSASLQFLIQGMVANGMAGHGRRPDHSDYHW